MPKTAPSPSVEGLGLRDTSQAMADQLALSLTEVVHQAESDLCGEQRDFHLPRLRNAYVALLALFPTTAMRAVDRAKDAWGRPLVNED